MTTKHPTPIFSSAWEALATARVHADATKNQSATICAEDACQCLMNGDPVGAMRRIKDSLMHSVGIFHVHCQMATECYSAIAKATGTNQ